MKRLVLACLFAAGALAASAQPENWIYQHNLAYQDPNNPSLPNVYYYDVSQQGHYVIIHHAIEDESFEFEAALLDTITGGYTGPGHIESIAADEGAGAVTITIVGHGHAYGAENVDAVSLRGVTGTVCTISGMVTDGDIGADGPIDVDRATGNWIIGPDGWANVLSDINVDCYLAKLYCATLTNVYVSDPCESELQPDEPAPAIVVGNGLVGTIDSNMKGVVIHGIDVLGSFTGHIDIQGGLRNFFADSADAGSTVHVGGDMTFIGTWFGPFAGAAITADGNVKDIWLSTIAGEVGGDVHVLGDTGVGGSPDGAVGTYTPLTGTITIDGDAVNVVNLKAGGTGTLRVGGKVDRLEIGDPALPPAGFAGTIDVKSVDELEVPYGDLSGSLIMRSDFSGTIEVGAPGQPPRHLTGSITALVNWTGSATITGSVTDPLQDARGGFIRIDGAFGDGSGAGRIQIDGTLGNPGVPGRKEYVCVDYDGWDGSDRWRQGAQVSINGQVYTGNAPAAHVYETTTCKGDSNNNGYVDFLDSSSMLLAINNPLLYGFTYPGLAGSRIFHCDLGGPINNQCDGLVNILDFQLFRLRWGCCSDQCGVVNCNGLTAGQTAAVLAETVSADLQPDLAAVVSEIATEHPEAPVREYWQEVQQQLP